MGELALQSLFDINGWDGLDNRCNHPTIVSIINDHVKTYYTVNVEDAMQKLVRVGTLLQLAYSGSKGHSCSTDVLRVLSRYQDLIKLSSVTSTTFVEVTLQALKYHKLALVLADKDKEASALQMIETCAALAERMAEETNELVIKSDELCKLSEAALMKTNDNQNTTEEEKRKIIDAQKRHSEQQVFLEKKLETLKAAVADAKEEVEDCRSRAEKAERKSYWRLLPVIGKDIAERAEKTAERYREKEFEVDKQRRQYQEEQRSMNADLAKVVQQLQNSNIEEDELGSAVKSLDIAVKTLGNVKTVFLNVKLFWEGVSKQCKGLSRKGKSAKEMLELKEKELFIDQIKESGYCWLALGKINRDAAFAIRDVDGKVDSIMNDLPTKKEAKRLVENLTVDILKQIAIDNSRIDSDI